MAAAGGGSLVAYWYSERQREADRRRAEAEALETDLTTLMTELDALAEQMEDDSVEGGEVIGAGMTAHRLRSRIPDAVSGSERAKEALSTLLRLLGEPNDPQL